MGSKDFSNKKLRETSINLFYINAKVVFVINFLFFETILMIFKKISNKVITG